MGPKKKPHATHAWQWVNETTSPINDWIYSNFIYRFAIVTFDVNYVWMEHASLVNLNMNHIVI